MPAARVIYFFFLSRFSQISLPFSLSLGLSLTHTPLSIRDHMATGNAAAFIPYFAFAKPGRRSFLIYKAVERLARQYGSLHYIRYYRKRALYMLHVTMLLAKLPVAMHG